MIITSTVLPDATVEALHALIELLRDRTTVVLTGAGCSTESGIPDYRGPGTRRKKRNPVLYQEFLRSPAARARYWAGSMLGWPRVARARPNTGHLALARLEHEGFVRGVITQNVDGLHQVAGSRQVIELHGNLERVRCLTCGADEPRAAVQDRLLELNPLWRTRPGELGPDGDKEPTARTEAKLAPDGDAEPAAEAVRAFRVPECRRCGGMLKPDVVFFGENVPQDRVERAWRLFQSCDALLVVGSSLTVYSGRRFVDRAARDDVPVAIVNLGSTRSDEVARVRVEARVGAVLPRLADALGSGAPL